MLGRHRMQVREKFMPVLDKVLAENGFSLTYADLCQADGYAETFFKALGWPRVDAMDLSDFEGAEVLHDLNAPLPDALKGQYGLVYDGGTTEHVFDVATCMRNIDELLAEGGILSACSPGNGWFSHGFYQFGPELVYGYWKHGCLYDVLTCSMLPQRPKHKEMPLPDPAELGHRIRMKGKVPDAPVYLYYEVQKTERSRPYQAVLQTDYVRKWSDFDQRAERSDSAMVALREEHKSNLQREHET